MTGNPSDSMPYDPVPLRTYEQAVKAAARRNKKLAAREPLLALIGEARQVTPEQILEDERRWRERLDEFDARQTARAGHLRGLVAAHCPAEQLAEFDAYRSRTYPPGGDYGSGYWFRKLRELAPALAQAECPHAASGYHANLAIDHAVCPVCGLALSEAP